VRGLPETDVVRVQRWCQGRVPEHIRDEVRVEVDVAERHLTIVECRPPWRADMDSDWTRFPIARLRYAKTAGVWSLYIGATVTCVSMPMTWCRRRPISRSCLPKWIGIPQRSFGADRGYPKNLPAVS